MRIYEAHHKGYELLEQRISKEVQESYQEGTLFRSNSIAAKLFSSYVRMSALPYIWFTLVTSINSINDNAIESFGLESQGTDTPMPINSCCAVFIPPQL